MKAHPSELASVARHLHGPPAVRQPPHTGHPPENPFEIGKALVGEQRAGQDVVPVGRQACPVLAARPLRRPGAIFEFCPASGQALPRG